MPDTNRPRLKVSRAGIVLIKSFESFRPRAVRRDDGRWVIGYGHTASAREGLTVGEQDAELLLQYDLIPVARALNEQVDAILNQHQFDALASFAVSVGVDRFLGSDVLTRLNEGHPGEAADALVGWPESLSPDAALRRRAAERALFVADPATPVLLSDLLAAPLPPPAITAEPEPEPAPEPDPEPESGGDPNLSRAAAVASLLGERPVAPDAPEAEVAPAPEPDVEAEAEPAVVEPEPTPAPDAPRPLPLPSVWQPQASVWATPASNLQRYSPYSAAVVGPLPGFPSMAPVAPPAPEPMVEPEVEPAPAPEPEVQPEPEAPEPVAPEPEPTPEPEVAAPVAAPVQVPVFAPPPVFAAASPSPFPPLELTPAVEADFAEPVREAWTPETRATPDEAEETVLFEDEPPLAVLRHEVEPSEPRRFSLIETGPYLIMGGLGLFSCAASAAAFRKAMSDPLPTNEFTVIAWVLALIGVICVGVSAWNLYMRAAKRD